LAVFVTERLEASLLLKGWQTAGLSSRATSPYRR
jgi:hypothetical protein